NMALARGSVRILRPPTLPSPTVRDGGWYDIRNRDLRIRGCCLVSGDWVSRITNNVTRFTIRVTSRFDSFMQLNQLDPKLDLVKDIY
ncbi:6641_t:CDS:1, partial [Acaulospora colombiana]